MLGTLHEVDIQKRKVAILSRNLTVSAMFKESWGTISVVQFLTAIL